jgi:hypothetical protein
MILKELTSLVSKLVEMWARSLSWCFAMFMHSKEFGWGTYEDGNSFIYLRQRVLETDQRIQHYRYIG